MSSCNCFVTGHRRVHLGRTSRYLAQLTDLAIAHGATRFYTGMALGTDQLAALEWTRRGLPWKALIPCHGYESRWSRSQQRAFWELLNGAEEILWLHQTYEMGCNHHRNRHMVEVCEMGIGIFDHRRGGGTRYTIQRAIARERPLYWINPETGQLHQHVAPTQLTLF